MDNQLRALIIGLSVGAVVVMVMSVSLLWRVMESLPWQVDCVIAAAAAFAFAYRFEREADRESSHR